MPAQGAPPAVSGRVRSMVGDARVVCTGRVDGDFADVDVAAVAARQQRVVARRWSRPRQVHGNTVIEVRHPGDGCGVDADALVTRQDDVALAVLTADCAPVAFSSPEGVIGVAHAGWRGLVAGVLDATVATMRDMGATAVHAVVGPCIHAECYEFGPADLDAAVAAGGEALRGLDRRGRPALDLPGGVSAALHRAGAVVEEISPTCTACSAEHWSWRAAQDLARQATVVWRAGADGARG